ncbi:MAG: multidrug efflux pump subunit AcrA (membrane-fusion protein) [Gammaproteobacteria bacterium]|jgi:multidrug efflux pump subunit AcrA (membrane-fusion protein)
MNMLRTQLSKLATDKKYSLRARSIISSASVLIVASVMSVLIYASAPHPVSQQSLERTWPVSMTVVKAESISPMFSVYGKVESSNIALIQSSTMESIQKVNVREGQTVKKGDVLVELNDKELNLRVRENEGDLSQYQAKLKSIEIDFGLMKETDAHFDSVFKLSQKKLRRHQELYEKRMISQAVLDEVVLQASERTIDYQNHKRQMADFPSKILEEQARIRQALARLEQAQLDLERAFIRAPFDGPIISVAASAGSRTMLGSPLLSMAQSSGFEIRAPVPNEYVDRFRDYLEINKAVRGFIFSGERRTHLKLTRLSNSVRPGQSGLDAFFSIEARSQQELPEIGRVVDLTIVMPVEEGVVGLPVQSLYENDRIYEVVDDRLKGISVKRVGEFQTEEGEYRVLVRWSNLTTGQNIITTQLPKAITGLLVSGVATEELKTEIL